MLPITDDDTSHEATIDLFDAAFDAAVSAYLRKEYQAALALFNDALSVNPKHAACLSNVALIERRLEAEASDATR